MLNMNFSSLDAILSDLFLDAKGLEVDLTHWPRMNKDFLSGLSVLGGNKAEIQDSSCLEVHCN